MPRTAGLKPRHHPNRKSSPWCVTIPPKLSDTGKRQERFFKTQEEAKGEVQRLRVRKENHGTSAKLLSPSDEQQAASAIRLLQQKGITLQLSEVVGDYVTRWEKRNASVTLKFAFEEYLKFMDRRKRSAPHRKSIENVRDRYLSLNEKLCADLSAKDIEKGLEGTAPSYRNALLVRIRAVLNYGMTGGRKWLSANPANDCELIEQKLGEVAIYSVEEIEKILAATAAMHPELTPAVAIMTFGGIRPDHQHGEIVQLRWDHIILKDREKRIELPASITKIKRRRSVAIRPALASWLAWHKERSKEDKGTCTGLVCPVKGQRLRTKLREIFDAAGVERIQDGLRHSFCSYAVPIFGKDKTELELGHGGSKNTMEKHYRSDVRAAIAKKFWAIRAPKPEKKASRKIIPFSEAA